MQHETKTFYKLNFLDCFWIHMICYILEALQGILFVPSSRWNISQNPNREVIWKCNCVFLNVNVTDLGTAQYMGEPGNDGQMLSRIGERNSGQEFNDAWKQTHRAFAVRSLHLFSESTGCWDSLTAAYYICLRGNGALLTFLRGSLVWSESMDHKES